MQRNIVGIYKACGVDVSSETLDVSWLTEDEKVKHGKFKNNDKGVTEIIEKLKEMDFVGRIVMESTGRYHEYLAVRLHEEGYEVYVANPLIIKKYYQAQIRKLKTDKNDSRLLAEIAFKEKKLLRFRLSREAIAIKRKINFIKSLEKKLQQLKAMMKNHREGQESFGEEISIEEEAINEAIKKIEKEKKNFEKEIIAKVFVQEDEKAKQAKEILTSISGVSEYYAALVYFYYVQTGNIKAKSWVAYSGLDISIVESGKWKGKGKISKRGNRYLRKRNYGVSWGAVMNNEVFRKYYDYLKQNRGRNHREALVIIGRKILQVMYYCLKQEKNFDAKRFESRLLGGQLIAQQSQ